MSASGPTSHHDVNDNEREVERLREELRAATEREAQARQALDEYQASLVSSLTHDLKNPLTTVMGRIEMLKRLIQRAEIAPADINRHLVPLDEAVNRIQQLLQSASQRDGKYAAKNGDALSAHAVGDR